MTKQPDWIERRQSTRRRAEQLLVGLSSAEAAVQPGEVLVHELLVHKVELEMQIEELQAAHQAMEESRDRYVDLYDLAPVGYFTLGPDGLINEVNLTGAAMLAVERANLVRSPFAKYIAVPDSDRWHRCFMDTMTRGSDKTLALLLDLQRGDGSPFAAYLDGRQGYTPHSGANAESPASMRLTVVDIGKIRQAEAELRSTATHTTDTW